MIAGLVAAAATMGVLVGFGHGRGAPSRVLNTVAHAVLGYRAEITDAFDPAVTLTAVAVHVAALLIWGILFALVAGRLRGVPLFGAAVMVAAAAYFVDFHLVPARLTPGFETVLTISELIAVYAVLAAGLTLGAAIGRPVDQRPGRVA